MSFTLARTSLLFSLFSLTAVATAQIAFTNETFATGPSPTYAVSGDFNHDGLPDLAVTDQQSGNVTILLGAGGGYFAFGASYSTGLIPTQIVAGDFNHDGKLDLAVALSQADAIAIFLGNGDGTFHRGTSVALDGNPFALVAADFNRDGIPDLAVIEHTPADTFTLKILIAKGDGTFTRTQAIPLPRKPIFSGLLVSDDFNIDGLPDLALATDTTVMVFTDSPTGTLTLHSIIKPPFTASIVGLAAGRVTRGPAPDLVVRVFDNVKAGSSNSEYVFLNTGSGFFTLRSHMVVTDFGGSVYIADINGDGLADLISVGVNFRDPVIQLAFGHGDGTFTAPVSAGGVQVIGSLGGAVVRDLNLDSRHDLVVPAVQGLGTGDESTHVFLNQNALTNCPPPGSGALAVRICTPSANATVPSVFTVRASGNSPAGVKRIELWVDGVKRAQNFSDQLHAKIALSPGEHRVTAVAVDLYDALVKSHIFVNVP